MRVTSARHICSCICANVYLIYVFCNTAYTYITENTKLTFTANVDPADKMMTSPRPVTSISIVRCIANIKGQKAYQNIGLLS